MHFRPPLLPADPEAPFPPPETALREPDGLLAIGGDLSPARLLNAYRQGIFPWYSQGQPILWWSPDPRMVFRTDGVRLSSRFRRTLRRSGWELRADTAFGRVIDACAAVPRRGQDGTWITPAMRHAYLELHRLGHAHSVEVYEGPSLVGGIYEKIAHALPFFHAVELEKALCAGELRAAAGHLLPVLVYSLLTAAAAVYCFLRQMNDQ